MKNAWLILFAVVLAVGVSGCVHHRMGPGCMGGCMSGSCMAAPETCAPCGCGLLGRGCLGGCQGGCLGRGACMGGAGMSAMQYPYYTTRGPRDFLVSDPAPLGP